MPINALIIDHEPLARQELLYLLQSAEGIEVVAQGSNGIEAVELVRAHKPYGFFLEGQMPGLDGFAVLKKLLDKEVKAFAKAAHFDLAKPLKLDSLWVNILKPGGTHSGHIHPHSIVSGTFYVAVPPGSGALKLEDPRLAMLMAAPGRTDDAPEHLRPFVYAEPAAGRVFLWESWLRHEVMPHTGKGERISISFNYR